MEDLSARKALLPEFTKYPRQGAFSSEIGGLHDLCCSHDLESIINSGWPPRAESAVRILLLLITDLSPFVLGIPKFFFL